MPLHLDAHRLLGLEPGADERAIKRAFRRLAMRWHPDRNSDPAAHEHFKALRAAYERLLAALRQDHLAGAWGEEGTARDGADDGREAEAAEEPGVPRGADRSQRFELSLEEACLGCEKLVEVVDDTVCDVCGGRGEELLALTRLCAACHGSGRLRSRGGLVRCGACGGRGYLNKADCTACYGSGRRQARTRVAVTVPAGIRGGDELRLAGKGAPSAVAGGRPGDLLLCVVLAPHPLFRLDGNDIVVRRPLSALRLLLGGELKVPRPGGVCRVVLEPGAASARLLRIEGEGFPGRRGEATGALVVELVPVLPEAADHDLRPLIERLEAALARDPGRHLPEVARWEARWLDR